MFLKFIILFFMYLWLCDAVFLSSDRRNNNAKAMRPRGKICTPPKFNNGNLIPLRSGRMLRFECKKGFIREGEQYVTCKNGRWDIDVLPICIKAGCSPISRVENGQITYINKKTTAILVCDPHYEAVGSAKSFCNGTIWDRAIGSCKETSNAPPLECDFETEAICGYIHANDNDLDFKRSSGYNNRTMTIATGPHADHTIGKPFEGHFMVINTNSELSNKKARLISQSYDLTQNENICIRFYYHMHGHSVGKLRIYQKPSSLNFEDVLIDDYSQNGDDNNKYLIFSMEGSQENAWIEGGAVMKVLNESFQIVIEAITGHTMMCDIAIDDVSILLDDDCINEDKATTPKVIEDDGDDVLDVQSCVGRCFIDHVTTLTVLNATLLCNCNDECVTVRTCCPDFLDVCEFATNATLNSTTISTTISTTTIGTTTVSSTTVQPTTVQPTTVLPTTILPTAVQLTTVVPTKPTTITAKEETTTIRVTTSTTSIAPTTVKKIILISTTNPATVKPTISSTTLTSTTSKPLFITNTTELDDETIDEDYNSVEDNTPLEITEKSSDKLQQSPTTSSHVIKYSLISLGVITTTAIILAVAVKSYKVSTNPLNYKQNSGKNPTKNVTDFSEVRFLTDEECLDFNIANSDSLLNNE